MNSQHSKQEIKPVEIKGDVKDSNIVIGSHNIVVKILQSIDKSALDRDRSITYKEMGRAKVQEWGEQLKNGEWNWHKLGQAIEHYTDSIKFDPKHQHPWTNLSFVYHLIGERQLARECLDKSFELAEPGPNHPGGNYKRVNAAIEADTYLSGGKVARPEVPEWFKTKYEKFLK